MFTHYDTVQTHFDKVHSMFTQYDTVNTHFGTVHTLFTCHNTVHTRFKQFTQCSHNMTQFTHTLT